MSLLVLLGVLEVCFQFEDVLNSKIAQSLWVSCSLLSVKINRCPYSEVYLLSNLL